MLIYLTCTNVLNKIALTVLLFYIDCKNILFRFRDFNINIITCC